MSQNYPLKQESIAHSKGKNKATEAFSERDLMVGLLNKYFKTTALRMLKELKKDVEKMEKKMIYKQNRNINKEIENLKRKKFWSCESYNN